MILMATAMVETIPNMSTIFSDMKSQKKLLTNLKSELDIAIMYFSSVIASDNNVDDKIKSLLTVGYSHVFKIMSHLEIAMIKEENQSTKIKFEEAQQHLIPIPVYIGSLHDIIKNANNIEAGSMFDIVKVKSKLEERDSMLEQFTKQSEKIIQDSLYIKNNCLNNHVNLTLLSIIKSNEVLKKD
jgi:hypothetical protein